MAHYEYSLSENSKRYLVNWINKCHLNQFFNVTKIILVVQMSTELFMSGIICFRITT